MKTERWRKRDAPDVVVEVVRLNEDNVFDAGFWCGAERVEEIDPEHPEETQTGLNVPTAAGTERASLGMYIAKYGRNFFVSHTRPFEMMYEPVDRMSPPPTSIGEARRALGFGDYVEGPRIV